MAPPGAALVRDDGHAGLQRLAGHLRHAAIADAHGDIHRLGRRPEYPDLPGLRGCVGLVAARRAAELLRGRRGIIGT